MLERIDQGKVIRNPNPVNYLFTDPNYLEVEVPNGTGTETYTYQIDGNSQISIQKGNSLYAALLAAVTAGMKAQILHDGGTL